MRAAIGARAIAGGPIAGRRRRAARAGAGWTAPRAAIAAVASDRRMTRASALDDDAVAQDRTLLNPAPARPARAVAGEQPPEYRARAARPEARAG
jgi:hypothetical protein